MADFGYKRPRERLSAYLAATYGFGGENRNKRLARDLARAGATNMTERAARNLFAGHWPGDETWAAIVRRFGNDVLRVVFHPEIEPVLAELAEREARLAREIEALRLRRREVQGFAERRSHLVADDQAEADAVTIDLFEGPRP